MYRLPFLSVAALVSKNRLHFRQKNKLPMCQSCTFLGLINSINRIDDHILTLDLVIKILNSIWFFANILIKSTDRNGCFLVTNHEINFRTVVLHVRTHLKKLTRLLKNIPPCNIQLKCDVFFLIFNLSPQIK